LRTNKANHEHKTCIHAKADRRHSTCFTTAAASKLASDSQSTLLAASDTVPKIGAGGDVNQKKSFVLVLNLATGSEETMYLSTYTVCKINYKLSIIYF